MKTDFPNNNINAINATLVHVTTAKKNIVGFCKIAWLSYCVG